MWFPGGSRSLWVAIHQWVEQFAARQQKHQTLNGGTTASPFGRESASWLRQVFVLEKSGEEFLGEVLSVLRRVSVSPHNEIEGVPISLAEFLKRLRGVGGRVVAGLEHHTPVSCGKSAGSVFRPVTKFADCPQGLLHVLGL